MANLRLFSAAYPWHCELPDIQETWTFGFSNHCFHPLPLELSRAAQLDEKKSIFTVRGTGEAEWEIFREKDHEKDPPSQKIKFNGRPLEKSALSDGDILTLGTDGHILVNIEGKRAKRKIAPMKAPEDRLIKPQKMPRSALQGQKKEGDQKEKSLETQKTIQSNEEAKKNAGKKAPPQKPNPLIEKKDFSVFVAVKRAGIWLLALFFGLAALVLFQAKPFDFEKEVANHHDITSKSQKRLKSAADNEPKQKLEKSSKPLAKKGLALDSSSFKPVERQPQATAIFKSDQNRVKGNPSPQSRFDNWPILIKAKSPLLAAFQSQKFERLDLSQKGSFEQSVERAFAKSSTTQKALLQSQKDLVRQKNKTAIFSKRELLNQLVSNDQLILWPYTRPRKMKLKELKQLNSPKSRIQRTLIISLLRTPIGPPLH